MTSKVAATISAKASNGWDAAAMRAAEASAAAVITGPSASTWRAAKAGAAASRCQRHWAPSAMNRLSPMAGSRISRVTVDLG